MISAAVRNAPKVVSFPNGSNGSLVGHLYLPKTYNCNQRYPAVVVGGSMASVKEQMSGTYASQLAHHGIIAMAIDYTNWGESSGAERYSEVPTQKAKDLSSAVSYLVNRKDVAATALLGICTSGGNILYASAEDHRVRALVTVAGFFGEPDLLSTLFGADGVESRKASGRQARDLYRETGEIEIIKAYSDTEPAASKTPKDSYYMDQSRGGGVRAWRNSFAVMSWESWLAFDPVEKASYVTAPTLMIHSQKAAFPTQASKVYDLLAGPKECIWTEATHFDFYDNPETVQHAVQEVAGFLHKTLVL
ncbi:alpha/beta-hydrolase [Aspergillus caelatus]|uniref:Alpha/beta-hydrolase n=1 Tax=Aspergillus caelatus TaxID=61420 RepID=A0A5N6ZWN9_9EURO|nr:alpha/beta-hydrolase [Aspergillus caelatus]KAE8361673.1 alpha/beta-hydrolase [Aspergillus caelatus]